MTNANNWRISEPDVATILSAHAQPLEALAAGEIPAVVIRGAFPKRSCEALVDRLVSEELLYDPKAPIPEKFIERAIPEGYYREGRSKQDE